MKKIKQSVPEYITPGSEPIHKPAPSKGPLTIYAVVTSYTEGTAHEKFFKTREKATQYLESEYGKYKQERWASDRKIISYSSDWDTEHYIIECEVED